jgi:glyoxylase-like metal-dependent hydrolase (beta-lactamase superfamily II)
LRRPWTCSRRGRSAEQQPALAATILIAGDAVPTQEHFLAGQVLPDAYDIRAAQEAMREVYEIADQIVPGHDNIFVNPRMMGM